MLLRTRGQTLSTLHTTPKQAIAAPDNVVMYLEKRKCYPE